VSALIRITVDGARIAFDEGRAFTPITDWLAAAGDSVLLPPDADPFVLDGRLDGLKAIAIEFPNFKDGRGFSIATILRARLGWRGELRAVGDVSRDRLAYMARCGFDAFQLREGEDAIAALSAFKDFSVAYQGAIDQPLPLFRRRAEALVALAGDLS
jgi:uncharacterized protein (DUF934 family)